MSMYSNVFAHGREEADFVNEKLLCHPLGGSRPFPRGSSRGDGKGAGMNFRSVALNLGVVTW